MKIAILEIRNVGQGELTCRLSISLIALLVSVFILLSSLKLLIAIAGYVLSCIYAMTCLVLKFLEYDRNI